jgi:hypothetical protein
MSRKNSKAYNELLSKFVQVEPNAERYHGSTNQLHELSTSQRAERNGIFKTTGSLSDGVHEPSL